MKLYPLCAAGELADKRNTANTKLIDTVHFNGNERVHLPTENRSCKDASSAHVEEEEQQQQQPRKQLNSKIEWNYRFNVGPELIVQRLMLTQVATL